MVLLLLPPFFRHWSGSERSYEEPLAVSHCELQTMMLWLTQIQRLQSQTPYRFLATHIPVGVRQAGRDPIQTHKDKRDAHSCREDTNRHESRIPMSLLRLNFRQYHSGARGKREPYADRAWAIHT